MSLKALLRNSEPRWGTTSDPQERILTPNEPAKLVRILSHQGSAVVTNSDYCHDNWFGHHYFARVL